jgi:hypothetical protein
MFKSYLGPGLPGVRKTGMVYEAKSILDSWVEGKTKPKAKSKS